MRPGLDEFRITLWKRHYPPARMRLDIAVVHSSGVYQHGGMVQLWMQRRFGSVWAGGQSSGSGNSGGTASLSIAEELEKFQGIRDKSRSGGMTFCCIACPAAHR